jgi:hypothetical protein
MCDNWCQKWDWIDWIIRLKTALDCYIVTVQKMEQMMARLLAEMKVSHEEMMAEMRAWQGKSRGNEVCSGASGSP